MILEDEFGDIVRKARYGLGLTVEDTAIKAGIDPQVIADLEGYKRPPTRNESDALALALHLEPVSLWTIALEKYSPDVSLPSNIDIERFVFTGMNSNGYMLHLRESHHTFVIDPGGDPSPILASLDKTARPLNGILITHGHADHVDGVARLHKATGAPVYAHAAEWAGRGLVDIANMDEIILDGSVTIGVIRSPGHTAHGITFTFSAGVAAVGDTMFAGSLGRSLDGPAWFADLLQSAHKILSLAPDTILLPGHGPLSTVSQERVSNPFVAGAIKS